MPGDAHLISSGAFKLYDLQHDCERVVRVDNDVLGQEAKKISSKSVAGVMHTATSVTRSRDDTFVLFALSLKFMCIDPK